MTKIELIDSWATARSGANSAMLWLLVVCTGIGQVFRGFDSPTGMAIACLLSASALLLATVLYRAEQRTLWAMRAPLALAAAAATWAVVATALASEHWPEFGTPRLLALLSGLFTLIVGAVLAQGGGERVCLALLDRMLALACTAAAAAIAVLAIGDIGMTSYWSVTVSGRFGGLMGNANISASVAGVFLVYAVGRLLRIVRLQPAGMIPAVLFFSAAAALMATILLLTGSRFPALVTLAALAVLMAPTVLRRGANRPRLLALTVGIAGVAALLFYLNGSLSMTRLKQISPDLGFRVELWRHLGEVVTVAPWTGFGLGSFPDVHAHYLTTPRMAERFWMVNSAHNLWLQLLIVGGWPYLVLLGALALSILLAAFRRFGSLWNLERRMLLLMPAMIFAFSLVDIALDVPATTSLFALTGGLLWGLALQRPEVGIADA